MSLVASGNSSSTMEVASADSAAVQENLGVSPAAASVAVSGDAGRSSSLNSEELLGGTSPLGCSEEGDMVLDSPQGMTGPAILALSGSAGAAVSGPSGASTGRKWNTEVLAAAVCCLHHVKNYD